MRRCGRSRPRMRAWGEVAYLPAGSTGPRCPWRRGLVKSGPGSTIPSTSHKAETVSVEMLSTSPRASR